MKLRNTWMWISLAMALAACGSADDTERAGEAGGTPTESPAGAGGQPEDESPADPDAPTFHRDVAPVLEDRCGACHKPGGLAAFLDWHDPEVSRNNAAALLDAVESGRMPPWPPSAECRTYQDERRLTAGEKDLLRRWVEGGARLGEPSDVVKDRREPPAENPLGNPDFRGHPTTAYTPQRELADDYRCFILDPELDEDRWVRAIGFRPDNGTVVHHVLLFALDGADRAAVEALDAAEPGPGYTCFGGPGTQGGGALGTLGGWAPGAPDMVFPPDAGVRLRPGAVVVMQVHYNLSSFDGRPDRTGIELAYHEGRPAHDLLVNPIGNFALRVPAGEDEYTQDILIPNTTGVGMKVYGIFPHMHTRGTRIRVQVERKDGGTDCLTDIPQWDFHWQGTYRLSDDNPVRIGPEDSVRLSCTYDNGGNNARLVTWGEGTEDEMCLAYLTLVRDEPLPEAAPRPTPPPGEGRDCGDLGACVSACNGEGACELGCQRQQSAACQECYFTGTFACGTAVCEAETEAMTGCALGCMMSGDGIDTCPVAHCLQEYLAFTRCLAPQRSEGACNDTLARCGLEF